MDKLKGFAKLLWWLQAREVAFFKANWVVWGENRAFGVFFFIKSCPDDACVASAKCRGLWISPR